MTTAKFYDILYIQSEGKQGHLHSLRSALPHRYLRCISWISWNGHRPQPSTSWVASPQSATFSRRCLYHKAAIAAPLLLSLPRRQRKHLLILSPRKRKTSFFPFPAQPAHTPFLLCCSAYKLFARAACGPSAAGPSPAPHVAFRGPPINKKCGPAAFAANPLTTFIERAQKSVDFPLKKAHVGTHGFHAFASAAIDGPHSLPSFFLSLFPQRKRKKKTEVNSAGSNTSLGLTSFVLTMYALARRASSAEIYVAIATRFVRDCVEDLDSLTASMERIPKCSWHIKDHYPGVSKASRSFPSTSAFLKIFPHKNLTFPKKSAILYTQDEERKTHPFLPSSSNMRRQTQQTTGVVLRA